MILCVSDVLSHSQIEALGARLAQGEFADGRRTAGAQARTVKKNGQLKSSSNLYADVTAQVAAALSACELFQAAALPYRLSPLIVSRYERGMFYGSHVDNALMGDPPLRADMSFTLFLSEPESYGGGALVIEDTAGDTPIKLPGGSLVVYPSTYLHRVEEVKHGIRYAAVGWIQSHVPSAEHRRLLFQMHQCRRQAGAEAASESVLRGLALVQSNLTRLWAAN